MNAIDHQIARHRWVQLLAVRPRSLPSPVPAYSARPTSRYQVDLDLIARTVIRQKLSRWADALREIIMARLPTFCIAGAAVVFIALSATMNALFLSSLGRTTSEASILAALSVAADVTKAVLPVVVVRAIVLRAWGQVAGASLMLAIVIALSLASGIGFAALTRGAATAARQADTEARSSAQRQLRDIDARLDHLPHGRTVGLLDVEIARTTLERFWTSSNSCTAVATVAVRQFCADVLRLKSERAAAQDRTALMAERSTLAAQLASLSSGAGESDPQAAAVADVLGIDTSRLRRGLSVALAVTIELGSVILVLLLNGSALLRWRDAERPSEPSAVSLPHSKDVSQWHRRRSPARSTLNGSATDAR
jgi:hypothetical protein